MMLGVWPVLLIALAMARAGRARASNFMTQGVLAHRLDLQTNVSPGIVICL